MQKDLGTGYTIEEFDDSDVCHERWIKLTETIRTIYAGETYNIPIFVARTCFNVNTDLSNHLYSIYIVCDKPYCIIYKTKQE